MTAANLDAADLAAALAAPGLIREDVVDQVYNLDEGIPTPFIDMVSGGSFKNLYSEWTEDDLQAPDIDNAVIDGADASGNDTSLGLRVGNRAQLSDKVVRVSDAAEGVDTIGSVGKIAYQVSRRMMDLRRGMEATALGRQASVADTGQGGVAGRTAGMAAWIQTNVVGGGGVFAVGGFDPATKLVDAPVEGDILPLAWSDVRDIILAIYSAGGASNGVLVAMSTPLVIRSIVSFLFSDDGKPFRAVMTANVGGTTPTTQTAQGWIDVVLSDFGITLRLVANRLQQTYNSGTAADLFFFDSAFLAVSSLSGFKTKHLAETGHSSNRLLSNHWMTKVFREDAQGMIADINHALPVLTVPA